MLTPRRPKPGTLAYLAWMDDWSKIHGLLHWSSGLSTRARGAIARAGMTEADLRWAYGQDKCRSLPEVGKRTSAEIGAWLEAKGKK